MHLHLNGYGSLIKLLLEFRTHLICTSIRITNTAISEHHSSPLIALATRSISLTTVCWAFHNNLATSLMRQ